MCLCFRLGVHLLFMVALFLRCFVLQTVLLFLLCGAACVMSVLVRVAFTCSYLCFTVPLGLCFALFCSFVSSVLYGSVTLFLIRFSALISCSGLCSSLLSVMLLIALGVLFRSMCYNVLQKCLVTRTVTHLLSGLC